MYLHTKKPVSSIPLVEDAGAKAAALSAAKSLAAKAAWARKRAAMAAAAAGGVPITPVLPLPQSSKSRVIAPSLLLDWGKLTHPSIQSKSKASASKSKKRSVLPAQSRHPARPSSRSPMPGDTPFEESFEEVIENMATSVTNISQQRPPENGEEEDDRLYCIVRPPFYQKWDRNSVCHLVVPTIV